MWLVKRVFGSVPDIGRITLADVKPLAREGDTRGHNPDAKHAAELTQVPCPVDAVRLENGFEIADWVSVDTAATPPSTPLSLDDYDLVMLAVPENQVDVAASAILPGLRSDATVFDVVSTKTRTVAAMLKHAPEGVGVLGTHPLFGPAVLNVIGQTFMMVPTERTDQGIYSWMTTLLRSQGAIVEETDSETHDKYMLLVQTLAHYAYLVFGKTLAKASDLGYTFEESLRYSTPPYSILAAFTSRIIGGNPDLHAQIRAGGFGRSPLLFVGGASDIAGRFAG